MGHEVGLHFDVDEDKRLNNPAITDVEEEINEACQFLESITEEPVRSVSFHRPMPTFLRGPTRICGRINAYGQELMRNYMSDSKGHCRNGDPLLTLQTIESPIVQFLSHPIWWGPEHMTPEERLQELFETETKGYMPETTAIFDGNLAATIPAIRRKGSVVQNREADQSEE
jgi:hypothetical protein